MLRKYRIICPNIIVIRLVKTAIKWSKTVINVIMIVQLL